MRILFVTQYFHPETEIGGIRIGEIAHHLRKRGHEATILTGIPNYPAGNFDAAYRGRAWQGTFTDTVDGLPVIRVLLYPSHRKGNVPRLANYLSFAATASARSLVMSGYNAVVATSPPLTTGIPAVVGSILNRVPFILDVRDLWPEAALQLGYLNNPTMRTAAYSMEKWLYRRASRIVCVSGGIRDDIVRRGTPGPKCVVLRNGIDTALFNPSARDHAIEQLRAAGNIVGAYVGSLSAYHGLDHAVELLEHLRRFPRIKIVFAGGGSAEDELRSAVEARHLDNAAFLGPVSRRRMPGVIAGSQFCLVFVKESAFSRWLLSSKVFMYMACGRPIFAAASGETRSVIEESGAGIVCTPDSNGIRQLADQIGALGDGKLYSDHGSNGRAYAVRHCSWETIAAHYEQVLAEALGQASAYEPRACSRVG